MQHNIGWGYGQKWANQIWAKFIQKKKNEIHNLGLFIYPSVTL